MARREPKVIGLALALALSACTVFNGKTFDDNKGLTPLSDGGGSRADGGGCGCPAGRGILCEEFEAAAPGAAWETIGTAPVRDTARAHCGLGSLRVRTPAFGTGGSGISMLSDAKSLADRRLAGSFFARAWVYVPSTTTLSGDNYFTLMEVRQDVDPFLGVGVELHGDNTSLTNWTATPSAVSSTASAFPRDAWVCVEWSVTFDAKSGASSVWLGGAAQPIATITSTLTAPTPAYGSFLIGAYATATAPQPEIELWIDDVVLDTARVGCGP